MKTLVRNSVFSLAAFVSLAVSSNAFANNYIDPKSKIEVKFIGNLQSQPVFQVNLFNEAADEFFITISDEQGNVLYSDKVKGTNISRKFAINIAEVDDMVLRLDIKSKNTGNKESYNINRTRIYVIESTVTKVN